MAPRKKKDAEDHELLDAGLPPRTPEQFKLALRRKTKLFYDVQAMRLQAQGRILKKSPDAPIELYPSDLRKLTARVEELEGVERNALKDLTEQLYEVPFYRDVVEPKRKTQYRGLGPRMASVIIASMDIERQDTPSKMIAFAGLAPVSATRCKQCSCLVEESIPGRYKHPKPQGSKCPNVGAEIPREHVFDSGKSMRPTKGEKLRYNAWLRSKLCGVLGPVLLQVGSPYRRAYDDYKHRKQSAGWGTSDAHRHQAAIRYMVKQLLIDIWRDWRTHAKLPVRPSYQEQYLGHTHAGPRYGEVVEKGEEPKAREDGPSEEERLEIEEALKEAI